jgi:hypothetical protein
MLRNRLYNGCTFLLTDRESGLEGEYHEPNPELRFRRFASSLVGYVTGFLDYEGSSPSRFDV